MMQVREDRTAVHGIYSHPLCDRQHHTFPGIPWNHSTSADIIQVPFQQRGREFVVDLTTLHLATHDELVASPAMVCALAVGGQGATKIAGGDQDHLVKDSLSL